MPDKTPPLATGWVTKITPTSSSTSITIPHSSCRNGCFRAPIIATTENKMGGSMRAPIIATVREWVMQWVVVV